MSLASWQARYFEIRLISQSMREGHYLERRYTYELLRNYTHERVLCGVDS